MNERLALPLLLAALCHPASAQDEHEVDAYAAAQLLKYHIPGMSLAVVLDGHVALSRAFGFANVELSVPVTPASVFMIGSMTKHFTAVASMKLFEEGKLGLEDPIGKRLTDVPNVPAGVTIHHLLSHTSGIVDYTEIPGSITLARLDRTPKDVVKPALELPMRFAPGERHEYSNTNYILLGMVLERVCGKSFGSILDERIFRPLQMTATRMNNQRAVIANRADGYNWAQDTLVNGDYMSPSNKWSSGGLVSSVLDLARWEAALQAGTLLDPATMEQMLAPTRLASRQTVPYGLGNELYDDRGHRVAGHGGEVFGFTVSLSRYVDDGLAVVVLCNLGDVPAEEFARTVAGMFLGMPPISFAQNKGIEDTDPRLTEVLKGVVSNAATGQVDAALFVADAQNDLIPLMKRAGPELLGQLGALQSFVLLERKDESGKRVCVYRSAFKAQSLIWTFQLTPEGKIAAMEPKPE